MARKVKGGAAAVFSRTLAAIVGGYTFTTAVIIATSLLPGYRANVVLWSSLAGFAVWTAAVMWVFAASTALRAWLGLAVGTALASGIILATQAVAS